MPDRDTENLLYCIQPLAERKMMSIDRLRFGSTVMAIVPVTVFLSGYLNPGQGAPLEPSTWEVVSSTGEITITESDGRNTDTWSYPADPDSGPNWVRVNPAGELEFALAFEGVEGSHNPDGFSHVWTGKAEDGEVFGLTESEESFGGEGSRMTVFEIDGTYDSSEMAFSWNTATMIEAGHVTTEVSGSGVVRARRLIVELSPPN